MIEFNFTLRLMYRDARAYNDVSHETAHDQVTKLVFEALAENFDTAQVVIEIEPV